VTLRLPREIRLGVKNLWLHRLRSLLTMMGIVFGVASVVAMLAVGEGAGAVALEQIRRLGSNNLLLSAQKPAEDEAAARTRSFLSVYGLAYADEERVRAALPAVKRTVPAKVIRKEGRLGPRMLELRVVGTTPGWFELVRRPVLAGRVLAQGDLDAASPVCVLTEQGARRLLATKESLGRSIRAGGDYFEVVGIVASESASKEGIQPPDAEVDAYIPLNVCRERFGDVVVRHATGSRERELVELHQLLVEVDDLERVEATADALRSLLARFHKRQDWRLQVPLDLIREAERAKQTSNLVLGSIAGISLLVGGIGIMNIMLASVTERTREIGVRRAVGARRRQIVRQFLIESLVLSVLGGLAGVGVGVALPLLIEKNFGMPTIVKAWSIALAVGVGCGIGLLFGLYPAARAANLDPIEALRHE